MARGRMLNKTVCASRKFDGLPDDTCRLMATWIISQLDVQGVFYGDPAMVRSLVFPRRSDVTEEQITDYLKCMEQIGLIKLYEAKNDTWQWWPGFRDNQIGLRADRESPAFPSPPDGWTPIDPPEDMPDDDPPNDGHSPESGRQDDDKQPAEEKLSEVKGKESSARAHEELPPTDPDNPETAAWIADLESTVPPPRDPPHSEEEFRERVNQASAGYFARAAGEPWLAWGADHRDIEPHNGTSKEAIQQVGYLLEHEFGVRPPWNSRSRVKQWVIGLAELWETADGDVGVIRQAASEYRQLKDKDGRPFRISRPQSLFNTLSGMMSEKREQVKPKSTSTIGGQRFRKVQVGA